MTDFIFEMAKDGLGAFWDAVTNYPITCLLVFGALFAYLHNTGKFQLFDTKWRIRADQTPKSLLYAAGGFSAATFVSWGIGGLLDLLASAINNIFGTVAVLIGPFGEHAFEYSASLLALACIAIIYLLVHTQGRLKRIGYVRLLATAIVVLFATNVLSTLWVSIDTKFFSSGAISEAGADTTSSADASP